MKELAHVEDADLGLAITLWSTRPPTPAQRVQAETLIRGTLEETRITRSEDQALRAMRRIEDHDADPRFRDNP